MGIEDIREKRKKEIGVEIDKDEKKEMKEMGEEMEEEWVEEIE